MTSAFECTVHINPIHVSFTESLRAESKSSRLSVYEKGGGDPSRQPGVCGGMPGSQSSPSSSFHPSPDSSSHIPPPPMSHLVGGSPDSWVSRTHLRLEMLLVMYLSIYEYSRPKMNKLLFGWEIQNW